jgi:hypothetical protein
MDNVIHYWDYCNIFPLTKKSPNEGKDAGAKEPCGSGEVLHLLKVGANSLFAISRCQD